jgi:hypothetical protein
MSLTSSIVAPHLQAFGAECACVPRTLPLKNGLVKAYVSSTSIDLKSYREAVYKQLRKLRIDVIAIMKETRHAQSA